MQPPVFYAPPECRVEGMIHLPESEARHAAAVLRLVPASTVIVIDGLGTACRGELVEVSRRKATVRVHAEHRNFGEPGVRLTLAAGMSTGDKFDSVVQKGTELGVKRFVPILAEKSKVTVTDPGRARTRVRRLEKVALAAAKQCRRAYRPEIALPTDFLKFLGEQDEESLKLLFHTGSDAVPFQSVDLAADTRRVTLLVGPESGFSDDEARQARQAGFRQVALGARILRTETAGPVAVALVMQRLGEFS
ncbi:MAG TPA: 16S rRNA (uracil(1498)-N(3))-methyltransferase [Acidobacteriota bacterium]|nr:16S rRNA (uracil(1498)-N(3))-methyltransferase [Acidobacteriota bacterium]